MQSILNRLPPELRGRLEEEIRNKNSPKSLMRELQRLGVKHTPENIVRVARQPSGRIVFLETGNSSAGLEHILGKINDFAGRGVNESQIPDLVMAALSQGRMIGSQGKKRSRLIYEVDFAGVVQHIAVTIGDNGFIVGANPADRRLVRKLLGQENASEN